MPTKKKQDKNTDMRKEYDFSSGVRGKYRSRFAGGNEAQEIYVWFDPDGDFLEVLFETNTMGYFKETRDDRVMVRVDMQDRITGFHILGVSTIKQPLGIDLQPVEDESPNA
jgi:hypothetical protein